MKYLAAYALLSLAGNKNISAADIKKVLGAAGANVSDEDLNRLIESLKGKDVNKLIAQGSTKLGGSGSTTAVSGNNKAASKPAEKKQQPKKQAPKKKEQPKEQEQDFGLGGGLFD